MKKKSGLGINSKIGIGMAIFLQAGTSDLSKISSYKDLIDKLKDTTGNNNQSNYPYNVLSRTQQLKEMGADMFNIGLNNLRDEFLIKPNLNPEMGSMNEAVRGNAYNYESQSNNSNKGTDYSPIDTNNSNNYLNDNTTLLMNNLEKINRNNPNKIVSQYTNSEEIENIARNATEEFYKRIKKNK